MDAEMRSYAEGDLDAVTRIWREVGWIDDSDRAAEALAGFTGYGTALVGEVDGAAECFVHRTPGVIRYQDEDLPLSGITAVTTSAVGRGGGLASRLTTALITGAAEEGAAVAALGMFEQGFYDRFGLGTLGYNQVWAFDPAALTVAPPARRPVRVARDDWPEVAGLMGRRHRVHGGIAFAPPESLRAEMGFVEDPYLGLGFRADDGRLTACAIGTNRDEHGPFRIDLCAYETHEDLGDLLGLLRSLSAQLHHVEMDEPPGIQLQDLLDRPIRGREPGMPGFRSGRPTMAWYQLRALDLGRCVAARRWPGEEVSFDLVLTDPLSGAGVSWPGLAGDHTVTIGEASWADAGHRGGLPVLRAGIGAFSRMWFGVRPASGLAFTDDLHADPELLARLDRALLLPPPAPGIHF